MLVIIFKGANTVGDFNPLNNDALCFVMMNKWEIQVVTKNNKTRADWFGGSVIDENPNVAVTEAIMEKHKEILFNVENHGLVDILNNFNNHKFIDLIEIADKIKLLVKMGLVQECPESTLYQLSPIGKCIIAFIKKAKNKKK